MTQKNVYYLIKELGGTATRKQILDLAKRKNLDCSLTDSKRVGTLLSNLCKWEYIKNIGKSTDKGKGRIYKIVDEFPI